jgi:DNA-binding transcriptional LysR family regulator
VLEAVQRKSPQLSMILRALNQPELIEAIERDELDVVISLIPDKLSSSLQVAEIIRLQLVLLLPKGHKVKSASELWRNLKVIEPLIALKPNELICQLFQETLAKIGVSWLPKIEMDSLDLIERYVERGFGIGLSVRTPRKKFPTTVRVLDLPGFPPVRLGAIYRSESESNARVSRMFLDEVNRHAARMSQKRS